MIHHLNALTLSDGLRENLQDGGDDLPLVAIEANLAEYADNCASWHWHEFAELGYVTEGTVECCTPSGAFVLGPGEGYYVNASVLHLHRMRGAAATLRVIQFLPSTLGGTHGILGKYIAPVTRCGALEAVELKPGDDGETIDGIAELYDLARREPKGYELDVVSRLYSLWRRLYEKVEPMLRESDSAAGGAAERVKLMLSYIHTHYAEPVSVADIAASASVSDREAFRCFRQVLDTTPALYLQHHRVNSAARMLLETSRTITEISLACGFSSPSYMCKAFHDINGMSPRDFRKARR